MMTTITISLPADHLRKLQKVAAQYCVAPEAAKQSPSRKTEFASAQKGRLAMTDLFEELI